ACRRRRRSSRSTCRRLRQRKARSTLPGPRSRSGTDAMRRGTLLLFALPGALAIAFFFVLPLAAVSLDAFGSGAFARVVRADLFWAGLRNSLVLAVTASAFSLAVGFAVALHLSRVGEGLRTVLVFFIA